LQANAVSFCVLTRARLLAYNASMNATIIQTVRVRYNPAPLREAIERLGLSQRELARERGVHYVTLNRALTGQADYRVSAELVEWLCARLGVPQGAVYEGTA
jgi:hypothetical protein